jgi:regulator of cell morphogenesis and NO signaling
MTATQTVTIGQLVAQRPGLSRLFGKLGIDYCCGGKRTLRQACEAKGLDSATVAALLDADQDGPTAGVVDVSTMSLTELADHIEQTHHHYLKLELPRLHPMIEKIAARHSDKNSRLGELTQVYAAFRSEMEAHMAKEEQILFPWIRQIDELPGGADQHCGGIDNPIRVMEMEHQHAGDAVQLMRELTDGFSTPPSQAANTMTASRSRMP